ncbi:Ig-like domain-containing protein [Desulfococcaceae bacterium HSG8]|nr:Ig-like domain-containing protein [Desulfococcaceae bacterium HSG8]
MITVIPVDDPPVLAYPMGDFSVNEDSADTVINVSSVFADIDSEITESVYSDSNPSLLSAGITDRVLTLNYHENQFGEADITIRGMASGVAIDDTFKVTVNPVDDGPYVSDEIADFTVDENAPDTLINLGSVFADIDSEVITAYVLHNANTSLISATITDSILTLDYREDQHGESVITLQGRADGRMANDTFTVTVNEVIIVPVFTSPPVTDAAEDNAYTYTAAVTHPYAGETLTITAPALPAWLTLTDNGDGTAILGGTPGNSEVGDHDVSLQAEDSDGATAEQIFTVSVKNVNDAPVLDSSGDMTLTGINENQSGADNPGTLISDIIASGAADDPITDPDTDAEEGIAVIMTDSSNGIWQHDHDRDGIFTDFPADIGENRAVLLYDDVMIRFMPGPDHSGTVNPGITFRAWDRTGGSNGDTGADTTTDDGSTAAFSTETGTASITVSPGSDAPVFDSTDITAAEEDAVFSHIVTVTEPDADGTYTVTAPVIPDWLELSDNGDGTAVLTGTPSDSEVGSHYITVRVTDASGAADTRFFTLKVENMNDAPVLDSTGDMLLEPVNEDISDPDNTGTLVSDIIASAGDDPVTDPDSASRGIAVIAADTENGTWQYTLSDFSSFTDFPGNIAGDRAVLLNETAVIRFVPVPDFSGTAGITFRAWDQSKGDSGHTYADTTDSGGTSPFSAGTETAVITVNPVNDAPVLDNSGDMTLEQIAEDTADSDNPGTPVSEIILSAGGDRITDADGDAEEGVAVIAADNGNGTWQYAVCSRQEAAGSRQEAAVRRQEVEGSGAFVNFPEDIAEDEAVLLNDTDIIRFVPDPGFSGTAGITFRAWDRTDGSRGDTDADTTVNCGISAFGIASETAVITVRHINAPPAAGDDAYSTDEDEELIIPAPGILADDTDAEGDPLKAVKAGDPDNGSLTLNDDGSFTYTPDPDYNGGDSFTYKAGDGTDDSDAAEVTITVRPVNDIPEADNDSYSTDEDHTLIIAAESILANDTDADGDPLTAVIVSDPVRGSLEADSDGSFIYTPDPDYSGTDTFTYKADDGTETSDPAAVIITVSPVSDRPAAGDDIYETEEDHALTVPAPGVLSNDSDPDGGLLKPLLISDPAHGSLTLNPDGSFLYTPAPDYAGSDSFTYKAGNDTDYSDAAAVTIKITPVNDAPVGKKDRYTVNEDDILEIAAPGVLENDSDTEGERLKAVKISDPVHGSVTLNKNGSFIYTPDENFGGKDSFTYKAKDSTEHSDAVKVKITADPVNDAPRLDNTGDMTLDAADQDMRDEDNTGTPVSDIIVSSPVGDPVTDPDPDAAEGIAVIAVNNENGIWQYSDSEIPVFTDFPEDIAEDKALLLSDDAVIRFVPDDGYSGTISPGITFRAWDRTAGISGDSDADTVSNGGITAFSADIGTADITVIAADDTGDTSADTPADAADTDNDETSDQWEEQDADDLNPHDAGDAYADADGPDDSEEIAAGTDPADDADSITDSNEFATETEPAAEPSGEPDHITDNENDGMLNQQEYLHDLNPGDPDDSAAYEYGDGDGVIAKPDEPGNIEGSDDDGMSDQWEEQHAPNTGGPGDSAADKGGDSITGGDEVATGTAPAAEASKELGNIEDTGDAGISDQWEGQNAPNPGDPGDSAADEGGDSITGGDEVATGTEPAAEASKELGNIEDTGDGGMSDQWEGQNAPNPGDPGDPTDGDGLNNSEEFATDTDPPRADEDRVSDDDMTTDTDPDNMADANHPPAAEDGILYTDEDTAAEGMLNASDADGDNLAYRIVTRGEKGTVTLTGISSGAFVYKPDADVSGTDSFMFRVSDGISDSETAEMTVIIRPVNDPPSADAGQDQTADEGETVMLDTSDSYDPDDGIAAYLWEQTDGTEVILSDETASHPEFAAPDAGPDGVSLVFRLTVTDHGGLQSSDTCIANITWYNEPPVADAGPDQTVYEGETVMLDASGSSDPDDGIAAYLWNQTDGIPVTLSGSTSSQPEFTAPDTGPEGASLIFRLTVSDHGGLRSEETCIVNIMQDNELPVADAGPDQIADEGEVITLDASASYDPDGDPLTYLWSQTGGPPVRPSDPAEMRLTFAAPAAYGDTLLTFRLTTEDSRGLRSTDEVCVTVRDTDPGDTDAGTVLPDDGGRDDEKQAEESCTECSSCSGHICFISTAASGASPGEEASHAVLLWSAIFFLLVTCCAAVRFASR